MSRTYSKFSHVSKEAKSHQGDSPSLNEINQTDEIWKNLCEGIEQIYNRQHMPRPKYVKLYTYVYNYCEGNGQELTGMMIGEQFQQEKAWLVGLELYKRLRDFLRNYLISLFYKHDLYWRDEAGLQFYIRQWKEYRFSSKVLNGVFAYLNRYYVHRQWEKGCKEIYEIYQLAIVTWRESWFKRLRLRITEVLMKLIKQDRNGVPINTQLISDTINCYVELGLNNYPRVKEQNLTVYKKCFENMFIFETQEFYIRESSEFLRRHPVTEYMKKVEQKLQQEQKRVQYLHQTTSVRLIEACEWVLIHKHMDMFHSEFQYLLDANKNKDLRRMFQLTARTWNGHEKLRSILENHITEQGLAAIAKCGDSAASNPEIYVNTILEVHRKYNNLVLVAFNNDSGFVRALDKACQRFINSNFVTIAANSSSKSPELLAKYCDLLLKKGNKNLEETELEDTLNQIIVVFKYIDEKDVFEKFYRKMLAKRLVQKMSSNDAEASMISKLKQVCGYVYTSKLQRMFQDVCTSENLNKRFKKHLKNSAKPLDINFNILVLSSSWPFKQSFTYLPKELERYAHRFTTFYSSEHNGRKLNWLHSISTAELRTNCFRKRYTLLVSNFQMKILLMYNRSTSWTIQKLQHETQIKMIYLKQVIQMLLKAKLLTAASDDVAELTSSSTVELCTEYKNRKTRIDINTPIKMEMKVEQETIYKDVEEDRKLLIQTAIVRIMKMRQVLKHQQLVAEIFDQLRSKFNPQVHIIKKCIDTLIDKEYLERLEDEKDTYRYLA